MVKIETIEDLYKTVQVVERRKPREKKYIRAAPRSILFPSNAQVEVRLRFAESARNAVGHRGLCPCHSLPWSAHYVKTMMEGYKSKNIEEPKPKVYESRLAVVRERVEALRKAMEAVKSVLEAKK